MWWKMDTQIKAEKPRQLYLEAAWEGADIQRTDSVGLASDVGGMDGTELRPTRNVNEDKLI